MCVQVGTCVWARDSGRTGCGSSGSAERKKKEPEPTLPPPPPGGSDAKAPPPAEALANGFRCPGGKLGIHPALPHPSSCRLYYICHNGVTPTEAGCSSGTYQISSWSFKGTLA